MRYYEQKYPEVDELVMVQVRQIAEMGAYVKLVRLLALLRQLLKVPSPLARIRQHGRNDPSLRTISSSYKISSKTYPSWKERSRCRAKSRQGKRLITPLLMSPC